VSLAQQPYQKVLLSTEVLSRSGYYKKRDFPGNSNDQRVYSSQKKAHEHAREDYP